MQGKMKDRPGLGAHGNHGVSTCEGRTLRCYVRMLLVDDLEGESNGEM
jgi:hypothetical protein